MVVYKSICTRVWVPKAKKLTNVECNNCNWLDQFMERTCLDKLSGQFLATVLIMLIAGSNMHASESFILNF